MTTKLEQALADMEERLSEESFARWRAWMQEYARQGLETESGAERGVQPSASPSVLWLSPEGDRADTPRVGAPGLPLASRRVWVAWLVASIVGAAIWGLIILLGRFLVQVYA